MFRTIDNFLPTISTNYLALIQEHWVFRGRCLCTAWNAGLQWFDPAVPGPGDEPFSRLSPVVMVFLTQVPAGNAYLLAATNA